MVKILSKFLKNHEAQVPKFSVFIGQKSIFRRYSFKVLKMEFKFKCTILITNV